MDPLYEGSVVYVRVFLSLDLSIFGLKEDACHIIGMLILSYLHASLKIHCGLSQGKKSQFCSAHKQEGQVDVCNRRCQFPGCSKRPCFGLPGQRPSFCGTHRDSEMVDVISHKCGYPGCSHPAGYEANRVRSKFCGEQASIKYR